MNQLAVLIDERDRRIGKLMVPPSCHVVCHQEVVYVRTGRGVKLHPSHRAIAVVFEETEVYHRARLDPA